MDSQGSILISVGSSKASDYGYLLIGGEHSEPLHIVLVIPASIMSVSVGVCVCVCFHGPTFYSF